jgi:hypothetical protein
MEAETRFEISRDGVRTGGGTEPKKNAARVLVAGGSCAEGFLLDWPSSWAGVVEDHLNRPDARELLGAQEVHVGCVGRSRTGAHSTELILNDLLPRYGELQAIVLMVGATDLVDWMEIGAPNPYQPAENLDSVAFTVGRTVPFGWHPKKTALYQLVRRIRESLLRPISKREQVGAKLAKVRRMRAEATEIIESVSDPAPMLTNFALHLRRALECAQAHAKQVLLVRQPCFWKSHYSDSESQLFWDSSVGNPYHEVTSRYYSHQLVARLMEQTNDRATQVAEELGIAVLDLMPYLPRTERHYYDFYHFTPEGAAEVGRMVSQTLLGRSIGPVLYGPDQAEFPVSSPSRLEGVKPT